MKKSKNEKYIYALAGSNNKQFEKKVTHIFVIKINKNINWRPLQLEKAIEIDANNSGFSLNFIITNDQHNLMFASKKGILKFNCST